MQTSQKQTFRYCHLFMYKNAFSSKETFFNFKDTYLATSDVNLNDVYCCRDRLTL